MKPRSKPRVTVYIPCHDYGRFLAQAVESVAAQNYEDWELIIIDDGSADDTAKMAGHYAFLYPDRIRIFQHSPARGLQACANLALESARGDYVMRLDADDFLDENALLVLATYLDHHLDVDLVYPNYTYIGEQGEFLGIENRKKIGEEAELLDLPAHGACTMVRKRVLKSIGGYSEGYNAQDGHELWLKVLGRYQVANVSTPLFYYRRHTNSVSHDEQRIQIARQRIKRTLVEKNEGIVKPRIVAVVPAKNTYEKLPNIVLEKCGKQPLIDYTLQVTRQVGIFETVFVTTDDPQVIEYCGHFPEVLAALRPVELSRPHVRLSQVLNDAVLRLEQTYGIYPDILVLLSVRCPLRRPEHILEAIDTLLLYNVDSVISVCENHGLHFIHGKNGLEVLNRGVLQNLRLEREALYVDNGAIKVSWRDMITEADLYGNKIGHTLMPLEESFQIRRPFDAWLVSQILLHGATQS